MSSDKNKVDLGKVLRTNGYLLPNNENEVSAFESNMETLNDLPVDWDNPLNILTRGKQYFVKLEKNTVDENTVKNLGMAAREGNSISETVRKKMNDDRKNSRNT